MRRSRVGAPRVLVAGWALLLLCGCAATPKLSDEAADEALQLALSQGHQMTAYEEEAVADGTISFEEYDQVVDRFRACMDANGTPVADFRYAEEFRAYDWSVYGEYLEDPGALTCEEELALVDTLWQTQVASDMEPELSRQRESRRVNIIECMAAKGVELDADLPYEEVMVRSTREHPECADAQFDP